MAGYILHGEEKSVILRAADVEQLIRSGNGDAALVHLYLARADRGIRDEELKAALGFSELRLRKAESALEEMGLLRQRMEKPVVEQPERPVYNTEDISHLLETREDFRGLCAEVDKRLGRRMSAADQKCLAGLYDALGMPADVIYLLVCHCAERFERGDTRAQRLTVYQIEKEGYYWAQQGIFSQEAADRYLQEYSRKYDVALGYMHAMGLGDRLPIGKEKTYVDSWIAMGFAADAVALAYERTMSQLHELKFSYLGGILKKWHAAGLHTADEVQRGDHRPARPVQQEKAPTRDKSKMRQYAVKKG